MKPVELDGNPLHSVPLENFEACSLLGLMPDQIKERIESFNEPDYRSLQIYKWIHHKNVNLFDEMTNLSKSFRKYLTDNFYLKTLKLIQHQIASDGTEKFLWQLYDGCKIESVLIPDNDRNTVCISSQVGCSLACQFCATGSMGFIRNLTTGEIVEQILQIKQLSKHRITNVVFMGMGEPFLNYPRVIRACRIIGDPEGVAIRNKKITLSTSGIIPKIYQFAEARLPYGLAISLHAPAQDLRSKIMPIASKFSLDELLESARFYTKINKRNRITFEYVLLHKINDSISQMKQLISLLSQLRCKLNIISCNQNSFGFTSPPSEHLQNIESVLTKANFPVTVRKNRGEDISAACGQLVINTTGKGIFMKSNQ
jgi:23S rRNA (adenine2503-C2)-methyltransferase